MSIQGREGKNNFVLKLPSLSKHALGIARSTWKACALPNHLLPDDDICWMSATCSQCLVGRGICPSHSTGLNTSHAHFSG